MLLLNKFVMCCIFVLVIYMSNKFNFTEYNKNSKNISRTLRKNMTPQERQLWNKFLKNYPVKIYRQRPINSFIVDFYCSKAKLAIEVDGSQHYEEIGIKDDSSRTRILNEHGVEVIRFSNYDINTNFEGVCMEIDKVICNKLDRVSETF